MLCICSRRRRRRRRIGLTILSLFVLTERWEERTLSGKGKAIILTCLLYLRRGRGHRVTDGCMGVLQPAGCVEMREQRRKMGRKKKITNFRKKFWSFLFWVNSISLMLLHFSYSTYSEGCCLCFYADLGWPMSWILTTERSIIGRRCFFFFFFIFSSSFLSVHLRLSIHPREFSPPPPFLLPPTHR